MPGPGQTLPDSQAKDSVVMRERGAERGRQRDRGGENGEKDPPPGSLGGGPMGRKPLGEVVPWRGLGGSWREGQRSHFHADPLLSPLVTGCSQSGDQGPWALVSQKHFSGRADLAVLVWVLPGGPGRLPWFPHRVRWPVSLLPRQLSSQVSSVTGTHGPRVCFTAQPASGPGDAGDASLLAGVPPRGEGRLP